MERDDYEFRHKSDLTHMSLTSDRVQLMLSLTIVKCKVCELCSFQFLLGFLGQMRSLRIFYNDDACTSGQLVIASRESQYKILHFHHGGLDRLVETFADWKFLAQPKKVRLSRWLSKIRTFLF